jgi:pimeloyl-ACP methyl ester carboxylesterase
MNGMEPFASARLTAGIRSRFVADVNGLNVHVLEAGFEAPGRPCLLLLHGFPELAYSWRHLMLPLATLGYHVVAPDQRGYGRTTGWDGDFDGDFESYSLLNLVRDAIGLVAALGHRSVAAVIGHDYGSAVAAWCALVRPDLFRSVVLMSAPFAGPPALPFSTADAAPAASSSRRNIDAELAALVPPRKHYHAYYSTRAANGDMADCPQGIGAFLRAYFHVKSADWPGNHPHPLASWTAAALAKLPNYYVMDLDKGMAETVAAEMPSASEIAACRWLPEHDLAVYAEEFGRTGFQGGLHWYRCHRVAKHTAQLQIFAGRTIDVPSGFIAGARDWGVYQTPGAFERMQSTACTKILGCHLVENAGHWVQQEQPSAVFHLLAAFLRTAR